MTIEKGKCVIAVEHVEGFGKHPGLWVGSPGRTHKVANFKSEGDAAEFCTYLKFFLKGLMNDDQGGPPEAS